MRVAVAVRRLSSRGGLESNVLALIRHLIARRHAVTVVCQRVEPGVELDADVLEVKVPSALGESVKIWMFARAAARAIARIAPDASITSGHVFGVSVARLESGLVADYRDAVARASGRFAYARVALDPAERAAEAIERRKLRDARRVLVLSEAARASAMRRYALSNEQVRVARNGVDLAHFAAPTSEVRRAARRDLGVEGLTFAFIGNGYVRKGLDVLLEALAHPDAPTGARLLVAGQDRRLPAYRARAEALGVRAEFLGSRPDVRPILSASDGLVLPTCYDPFGLVVLEALALGRPAVTTRAAGASEILPHPDLVLEDPKDVPALARALSRLAELARDPASEVVARRAAEAHPLAASFEAVEAALEEARAR